MRLTVKRDREIATLGERAAAGAIDVGIVIAAAITGGAGFVSLAMMWNKMQHRLTPDWTERWARAAKVTNATAFRGASGALTLTLRNWRTPGKRILGIRRVDARTNGPVGARSAIVGALAQAAITQVMREFNRPAVARAGERSQAATKAIQGLHDSRPNAKLAELSPELMRIYIEHRVNPLVTPALLVGEAVLLQLPALRSRRRQTLTERVAGTVVIRER